MSLRWWLRLRRILHPRRRYGLGFDAGEGVDATVVVYWRGGVLHVAKTIIRRGE